MLTVYALVAIYATCYQLQAPLEPFLVERLKNGSSPEEGATAYARLQSFFQLVQMVGSFLVGYLLDIVGLRLMFALNFLGCAASYGILARADTLDMLWLSKLPTVLMAGFLCAQTAAAKLTPPGPARASALGRLTSAYTLGGVIGPALGGYVGVQVAARLAVVGSTLAVGLVILLPPAIEEAESVQGSSDDPSNANDPVGDAEKPPSKFSARLGAVLKLTWPLILSKMASGVVNSAVGAARPLLLKDDFHFDAARLGVFMSSGFFGSAMVGLKLGEISEWVGGAAPTIIGSLGAMCSCYLLLAGAFEPVMLDFARSYTPNSGVWVYAGLSFITSLFQFPLATTITALSTQIVPGSLKGTLVGCEHATFALSSLIGPTLGVACLQAYGLAGVATGASIAYLALFGCWRLCFSRIVGRGAANVTSGKRS